MIDWVNIFVPILHPPINGGAVVSIDSDGIQEWVAPKRIQATGSYDKKISFKSTGGDGQGTATHLQISGNPSKFLQGHNVFGSDDIIFLCFDTFKVIAEQFGLSPTRNEWRTIANGDYELKTVDINYSFELPSRSDVLAFIRGLEFKAKTRHGRPSTKGGTLYFGKSSSYWAFKFYCKAEEIATARGKLPEPLQGLGIEAWAENKLRAELRLMSKQLKRLGVLKVKDLSPLKTKQLFNDYLGQIDMTEQLPLKDAELLALPNKLRSTYTLWREGHDLRSMMSPATYKRHRKELRQYGINIDLTSVKPEQSNVVPFIRLLEATPAQIPDWAFTKHLVHHSAQTIQEQWQREA